MKSMNEEKPQRIQSENLIVEELRDELMIYDKARNRAFCLNQTAAFVWRHSDGRTTAAEMAELMARQLGIPVKEQLIMFALDALSKDGLLLSYPVAPLSAEGMTRRGLLQRMGMGAVAVPVVTVLFVSPLKAHASSISSISPAAPAASRLPHDGGFWRWLVDLF